MKDQVTSTLRHRSSHKRIHNGGAGRSEAGAIAGLICAGVSGFVMGFVMQGELASAVLMLLAALLSGCVGWWLRKVVVSESMAKRQGRDGHIRRME